ncbi:hypothetical protein CDL15_Pgr012412 [Punica granatum]|nr:hypothetical protein CDL15_Pgr012412 [Punica granatum]
MENILKEAGDKSLDQEFCQKIADSFSSSANRAGKAPLTWEQVRNWFRDKQKELIAGVTSSPAALQLCVDLSDAAISGIAPESVPSPKGDQVNDISELAFEARSFKDHAWYDVASFLTYRVLSTGELEARVRFAGYGKADDEWVNVKTELRERSIPLEPSECHRVQNSDLVLCFRDGLHQAIYYDAHIIEVERKPHDDNYCSCIFTVRYDHDAFEENVDIGRLCCRPTQEGHQQPPLLANGKQTESGDSLCITAQSLWG